MTTLIPIQQSSIPIIRKIQLYIIIMLYNTVVLLEILAMESVWNGVTYLDLAGNMLKWITAVPMKSKS